MKLSTPMQPPLPELNEGSEAATTRRRRDARGKPQFKDYEVERDQHQLFATNVFELLPPEHDCFLFADLIAQLDTTDALEHYSVLGQRAYDPKQLIAILIYSYSRGVFSSRQIEQRCREDLGFRYIAGSNCPNFRVLSDFRKTHGVLFNSCFVQTVKLAQELKLASLGHVSLDGSKFKANSSKHKAMSYKGLKAREKALCEEIEALVKQAARQDEQEDQQYHERTGYELPEDLAFKENRLAKIKEAKAQLEAREQERHPDKPIEDKKQISFADPDANIMGKNGHVEYAYNAQISVDSDRQIIVGQHVSGLANDYGEVAQALDELESNCATLPQKMSMDNGYYSGDNLAELEQRKVEAYVATNREDNNPAAQASEHDTRPLVKADFIYNEEGDFFVCPTGQRLELKRQGESSRRVYGAEAEVCSACPLKNRCCKSKQGKGRTLHCDAREGERRRMVQRMEQPESKRIYDERKVIVEPVFGQIKNTGFRSFSVRGKQKVAGEFSLASLVHNLKKIVRAATEGVIRAEGGKWVHSGI